MTLLIINDDYICNCINAKIAETSGLFEEVHCAQTAKDAFAFLDQVADGLTHVPDLVLLDVHVARTGGPDLLPALGKLTSTNKQKGSIVILSGCEDSGEIESAHAFSTEFEHQMSKSFSSRDLQTTIFSWYHAVMLRAQGYVESLTPKPAL